MRVFQILKSYLWKRIDSNNFEGLIKLEYLSLNDNEIEEIDVRSFESLSNLKELLLFNNKLKRIDRICFEPLKSIKSIKLYENCELNAISFIMSPTYGDNKEFISEWNNFLQQFPQIGKQ